MALHLNPALLTRAATGAFPSFRWLLCICHGRSDCCSQFFGAGASADVGRADLRLGENFSDGIFYGVGGFWCAQVAQHHCARPDLPDGVCDSLSGYVWSGAVDWLEHRGEFFFWVEIR